MSLRSSLPSWASWKTLGNGKALISGSPMWFHQGNYSFSIVAQSGGDEVVQNFDLAILVNDYPPRVQNQSNQLIYKKIQLFVIEDGSVDDVKNTVHGLRAFNPDKVAGETLRWLPYTPLVVADLYLFPHTWTKTKSLQEYQGLSTSYLNISMVLISSP